MTFRILLVAVVLSVSGATSHAATTDPVLLALRSFDANLAKALEPVFRSGAHGIDRNLAIGLAQLAKQSGFDTESTAELILAATRKGRALQQHGISPLRARQQLFLEGSRAIGESKKFAPDKRLLHIRTRFEGRNKGSENAFREKQPNHPEKRRDEKRYAGGRGGSKDKKDKSDSGNGNR